MTPTQAAALFALLRAAYPDARSKVGPDTADLWLKRLRQIDHQLGATAVQSLIDRCRFWPSISELNEQLAIAHEQALRVRHELERREVESVYDELERPPLKEIPAAVALLERFEVTLPNLQRVEDGPCDDCGGPGERCRIGRVDVCADCARRRQRAAVRVAADNSEAA